MNAARSADRRRATVLVVDDDLLFRKLVQKALELEGYATRSACDAADALRSFVQVRPDLIVLDISLPGMDGFDVLERVRDLDDVPVLMLTGRDREEEKVRALRGGADDYLTKPFGKPEFLARVNALLRRSTAPAPGAGQEVFAYADARLRVEFGQRLVEVGGCETRVTPLEFRLLAVFVRHPGQILSPEQLIRQAWRQPEVAVAQVKLYVSRLRQKLGDPDAIETIRGFGYRFRPQGPRA